MLFGKAKKLAALSDQELVEFYVDTGKNRFLGELFERYSHLVFGLCLKYLENEAESRDAVINIFEKLMTDLHRHEIKTFRSWLYMVAKNHCLMFIRERQAIRKRQGKYKAQVEVDAFTEDPNAPYQKEADLELMEGAIASLNEEQRRCIELFYLKEMCYQEITRETGFTLKQVKSFIQNGKRNLRIKMSKGNESITTQ